MAVTRESNKTHRLAPSQKAAPADVVSVTWSALLRFGVVATQYFILSLVVLFYQLEGVSFVRVVALTGLGFVIHHFLPMRWRLPFFSLLSLAGIGVAFGIPFGPAAVASLVGLGLLLIALAHLPIAFSLRLVLLAAVGLFLVAVRASWISVPLAPAIGPILGSMFMFRLLLYLYALKTRSAPFSFWRATAYFFMLPNVCFPLFPVVDYQSFTKTYYNDDALAIYQKGVDWMFRGIVHLLLYRFVYQHLLLEPGEVADAAGVVQYILATFLLYLKVSGAFHIIAGMLHLFGFNLSETHHLYMLSDGFTDFWRRINVYWKDFIQKLFFYPVYFRSRRWGDTAALVIATVTAFAATWLLHSYQAFWIVGRFPLLLQDVVFWGLLGALVLASVLYESKAKRRRRLQGHLRNWRSELGRAFRTAGTFVVIIVLWSFWTAGSLAEWATLMSKMANRTGPGGALLAGVVVTIGLGAVLLGHSSAERTEGKARPSPERTPFPFWRSALKTALAGSLLLAIGLRPGLLKFNPEFVANAKRLASAHLSRRDAKLLERGYYEDLTHSVRFSPELWAMFSQRPPDWIDLRHSKLVQDTQDFLIFDLIPSRSHTFKRAPFTTNRWGMRDRHYDKDKPDGCYRYVLLGDSVAMGSGVADGETFEAQLEDRLNRERANKPRPCYEILNLAVGGYGPFRKLRILETRGFDFDPDAILWVAHQREAYWAARDLQLARNHGRENPYQDLVEPLQAQAANLLETEWERELLALSFTRLAEQSRTRDLPVYLVVMRTLTNTGPLDTRAEQVNNMGREFGFHVLDVSSWIADVPDRKALQIADWDMHPNAKAHGMIADALYQALRPHLEPSSSEQNPR